MVKGFDFNIILIKHLQNLPLTIFSGGQDNNDSDSIKHAFQVLSAD